MKFKLILTILFIGSCHSTFSQNIVEIDSVSKVICDYLKVSKIENDTIKIGSLYDDQLYPYLRNIDQENVEKVGQQVYYRLQRNCVEFRNLLDRLEPPKEAAMRIVEKPESSISAAELNEFKEGKDLFYFEATGDTTNVSMANGIWKDSFTDGTFSKLKYKWISETEFELVFVESDNVGRSNTSVIGDRYTYQLLSKEDDYYLMSLNISGQEIFEVFKMYYN